MIVHYKKANDLLPNSALLRDAYGHVLMETIDATKLDHAIQYLLEANQSGRPHPQGLALPRRGLGPQGRSYASPAIEAMATYALAEEAAAKGNDKAAAQLAERAMKGLAKGSTYWLRAQDIKLSVAAVDDKADENKGKKRLAN